MSEPDSKIIAEKFSEKVQQLEPFTDLIGETSLSALRELITELQRNVACASQENRLLRIGVVGQIKRGKSSFLNALLFDGEEVLPKAASPMTAALTRIRHGECLQAEVEFYTPEEWQQVEATARAGFEKIQQREAAQVALHQQKKGGFFHSSDKKKPAPAITMPEKPTADEQACMELVDMVRKGGQNIAGFLGRTKLLECVGELSALNEVLADYVGAEGRFTPIVKSSCLTLNLPALENMEIIDTPGINDPIVSRSRVTQRFMGQCDVIFFLSNCGQFLDQADMRLLAQNIPARGIDDIYLIGSMFDSVLLDEGHKYKSLGQAACTIVSKLNRRAEDDFARICDQIERSGEQAYMVTALKKALPPLFVSSMAFNIARHWDRLDEGETRILQMLKKLFPQDDLDRETILELANLGIVEKRLEGVRQNKDEILHGKLAKLQERFEPAFRTEMRQIHDRLSKAKEAFENGSIEEHANRLKGTVARLEKGRHSIAHVFDTHVCDIRKSMATLMHELKEAALDAKKVGSRTGTDTQEEAYTVDRGMGFCFWRSLTGSRYETKHRTITVSYSYASVHDAIDQVERFILDAEKQLMEHVGESVNIEGLRRDILNVSKKMVDFEDDDFHPDDILLPVESAVARLSVPDVNLNCHGCLEGVTKSFNKPEVRDADIERLQQSIAEAVTQALNTIHTAVSASQEKICTKLSQIGQSFIASITADLEAQIKHMHASSGNLQQTLEKYDQALALISTNS